MFFSTVSLRAFSSLFPYTTLFRSANSSTSDYDALQAQFRRRLSRGLQALASYTWSHSIDTKRAPEGPLTVDRKSTRLNSSHITNSYAGYRMKKKKAFIIITSSDFH